MELLTLSREYKPHEIDNLDGCCKKMYHLLVTTIGGLEAITNYFHLIGSGHVVWMVRRYGNLWRFRNEGVEAFNAIVSLRHNKNNKKGGYKKTRKGDPVRKCAEFCERYELKIDYISMDQVCTWSQYKVNILLYRLVYLYILCIDTR